MFNRSFYDNGTGDQIDNVKIVKFESYELSSPSELQCDQVDK